MDEKILYQGDMLIVPKSGEVPPANPLTAELVKNLKELAISPETFVEVHGRIATREDLNEAMKTGGFDEIP